MPIALIVIGVIAVLVMAVAAFISTRPATYRVQRNALVHGSPAAVHALIDDFREWRKWSPWEGLDPNLQRTYSGAEAGPGAVYEWSGNQQAGAGRMTILESRPGERIVIKLEFIKPFASTSQHTFALTPAAEGTQADWVMEGENSFMGKAFGMFMSMDSMIGKDFEKGLAGLDRAVQSAEQA